jgi:hypothetical protein
MHCALQNHQGIQMAQPQPGSTNPHYLDLLDRLIAAPDSAARMEILARNKAERAHLPKHWPTMPTINFGPRETFDELRPRHLSFVEEFGFPREYDRDAVREYFLTNWYRLFGALRRSKALEVPSDQLRKEVMIARLLSLIELRRQEYKNERAGLPRDHHLQS